MQPDMCTHTGTFNIHPSVEACDTHKFIQQIE